MPKIIAFLIASAYLIYFIVTPPFTLHDERAQVKIIVGLAQGQYILTGKTFGDYDDLKEFGASQKILDTLKYIDHPDQIPTLKGLSSLKESENDYNIKDIYSHQAYSPPFYYLFGAGFYYISKITPSLLGQFYIMRLTSTLFYVATVFIAWKLLQLFIKDKKIAASVLLFFAINPLVLKMGIGVNPDIAVTFLSLCFLYLLLKLSSKKLETKSVVKLALLSTVATLTKISALFTNAVFMLALFSIQKFRKGAVKSIFIFQAIFLTLTVPWFLFMFNRYKTPFPEPFSSMCPKPGHETLTTQIIETFTDLRYPIMQYAGFMGEGWPYPFKWFFASYVLLFVMLLIIGLIYVVQQKKIIYKTLLIYCLPFALFIIALSAQFRVKVIDCDVQGRYILPVFFVLCLFVYWGIVKLTKDEQKAARILHAFAIFHFLFILFTVLIIRYYV